MADWRYGPRRSATSGVRTIVGKGVDAGKAVTGGVGLAPKVGAGALGEADKRLGDATVVGEGSGRHPTRPVATPNSRAHTTRVGRELLLLPNLFLTSRVSPSPDCILSVCHKCPTPASCACFTSAWIRTPSSLPPQGICPTFAVKRPETWEATRNCGRLLPRLTYHPDTK